VRGFSRKTLRPSTLKLRALVANFGFELERHLFRALLSRLSAPPAPPPSHPALQLLQEECEARAADPALATLLLWAAERPLAPYAGPLGPRALLALLRLAPMQELQLLAAGRLARVRLLPQLLSEAASLLEERLPLLRAQLLSEDRAVVVSEVEARPHLLATLLTTLSTSDLPDQQKEVRKQLQELFPPSTCPLPLPLLHSSPLSSASTPSPTMAMKGGGLLDGAMPDLVLEMGQLQGGVRRHGGQGDRGDGQDPHRPGGLQPSLGTDTGWRC